MSTSKRRRERVERNIYRRQDGRFEIYYRDSSGGQHWKTTGDTVTEARRILKSIEGAMADGKQIAPQPKLTFAEAAERWRSEQVADLRPATQALYRNAVDKHLAPRWGRKRLDKITADDVAKLIRELRAKGLAEWSITGILTVANRVFAYAVRRMNWRGTNPVALLDKSERPKPASTQRRRIFSSDELAQTLEAAEEPWRTLFSLAAVTGARLSECLALTWEDVALTDPDAAEVHIAYQVDKRGKRQPLKTDESRRTVEIPRQLAAMLAAHKLSTGGSTEAFVFATATGRALGQRNVIRALRATQTHAVDEDGRPTFPVLQERDERGEPVKPPRGTVPSFHGFRHSAASEAIAAGSSAEEVSWQLGHRDSNVTRAVYVQEVKSAERTARRRAEMETRYGPMLDGSVVATVVATERSRRQSQQRRVVEIVPEDRKAQ